MLFKYKIIDYRFCKPPSPHTVKYSLKRNDTVKAWVLSHTDQRGSGIA